MQDLTFFFVGGVPTPLSSSSESSLSSVSVLFLLCCRGDCADCVWLGE